MSARKLVVSVSVACLLLVLTCVTASAGEITLGASAQNVSFAQVNTSTLDVAFGCAAGVFTGTCNLTGNAFFNADAGMYDFHTTAPTAYTASFSGTGVFPVTAPAGASASFTYSALDGDALGGTIKWTTVNDGSANPHVDALLTITSVSGDSAFTSTYKVGQTSNIDMILHTLSCSVSPCNLDNVFASSGATASQTVSSGEVPVPEPASMALLGTALFGAYAFLRRLTRSA